MIMGEAWVKSIMGVLREGSVSVERATDKSYVSLQPAAQCADVYY